MFKTISAAATAILFGILILVEEITGTAFSDFENIYFIISIVIRFTVIFLEVNNDHIKTNGKHYLDLVLKYFAESK